MEGMRVKKLALFFGILLLAGLAVSASAAQFQFHGDLNNRFMLYTNQAGVYSAAETATLRNINKDGVSEAWGDIKYSLWVEAASDDSKIKGVYGIELGALRFGRDVAGSTGRNTGGSFSGDGVNIETRWAYTDFQLPWTERKSRVTIGLMPFTVNSYFWSETAMGVRYTGAVFEPVVMTLAWVRGVENFNDAPEDKLFSDLDALTARIDFKVREKTPVGIFAVYQGRHPSDADRQAFVSNADYQVKKLRNVNFNIYTVGTDGKTSLGDLFLNWDLIYQGGSLTDNSAASRDVSSFFAHADAGVNFGNTRVTYTAWYSSGDSDPGDTQIRNYLSTDIDMTASRVLMESYTNDNYFTESTTILDKGLILNKLAVDHKVSRKLTVGAALLYLQTAKDLTLGNGRRSKKIGTEIDAHLSYMLFESTEFAVGAGYLFADDAMDAFEAAAQRDGKSDADILRVDSRLRYTF
ncbi:MAG: hypothetical protein AB1346_04095 [Thermodesulfobacteriota bacterium]